MANYKMTSIFKVSKASCDSSSFFSHEKSSCQDCSAATKGCSSCLSSNVCNGCVSGYIYNPDSANEPCTYSELDSFKKLLKSFMENSAISTLNSVPGSRKVPFLCFFANFD